MRILVYPHVMEIGGSQINAVQLAGAVRDLGHEVIVLSEPGPVVDRVLDLGLEHIEIPMHAVHGLPSAYVRSKLLRLVRERRIDLIHGHESVPIIEAFFGPKLRYGVPLVGTIMTMAVFRCCPRTVPLVVGTEQIRDAAIARGCSNVTLLEPPVDTDSDDPAAVDGREFRARHSVGDDEVLVAIVSRLAFDLKYEGLVMACEAVGDLARMRRVRLIIVGGGPMREQLCEHVGLANASAGRRVVELAGEMADPRPAYAAADIVVGMGGSALRGLAFGKPLVVVGEDGFSEPLTPESLSTFLSQGWYGRGAGSMGRGSGALREALGKLVDAPELRKSLSVSARQLVLDRFSLKSAARLQERVYLDAIGEKIPGMTKAMDFASTAAKLSARILQRRYRTLTGTWLSLLLKELRAGAGTPATVAESGASQFTTAPVPRPLRSRADRAQ
jgi:glycosyltransferase involved in cell wall biosynthesis